MAKKVVKTKSLEEILWGNCQQISWLGVTVGV